MHDIEDLAAILGLTAPQIRRRLTDLDDLLHSHVRQGKRNKIIIDNAGLEILRRVAAYEKQGLSLSECKSIVKEELSRGKTDGIEQQQAQVKVDETVDKLLEIFHEQLREKDNQIKNLQDQIARLYNLIENRLPLPPSKEEIREKLAQRVSRWERFKQFLRGV